MTYRCCKQYALFSKHYCCLGIIVLVFFIMNHTWASPAVNRWVITGDWLFNNILLCDDVHAQDKDRALRTGCLTFICNALEQVVCGVRGSVQGKHPLVHSVSAGVFWICLLKVSLTYAIVQKLGEQGFFFLKKLIKAVLLSIIFLKSWVSIKIVIRKTALVCLSTKSAYWSLKDLVTLKTGENKLYIL